MKSRFLNLMVLSVFSLCSCGFINGKETSIVPENDDDAHIVTKEIPFTNLSDDFKIDGEAINTYFIDGSDVPYISLLDFLQSMNGFVNFDDTLRYKCYPKSNMLVLTYYRNEKPSSFAQFQWDTNNIYVSDFSFFSSITCENEATDYGSFIKYTEFESTSEKPVSFKLGSYYFDILYYNRQCLIPFVIANMLFCSQNQFNVYYNGAGYFGYYGEISSGSDVYKTIYICDSNGLEQSYGMRKATVNSLFFAMDYFYGLKDDKNIDNFKQYINSYDLDLLLSSDADDNMRALKHVIFGQLDELHTRLDGRNIYSNKHNDTLYDLSNCGVFWNDFYALKRQQSALREEKLGESVPSVRYFDDTAIITLDSFLTGSYADIYDSEGNVKDTAWKYDSYFYMRNCMKEIVQHREVNDVVLDLSLNGGGNIGALQRVLGFLTDEVLLDYRYDTLTNEFSCSHFKVDVDGDGYYDDDAYDQYRWTILSSMNTFSAANNFVCKVKNLKLGEVIGQKSGGGMCSVLPLVLADGTPLVISSNRTLRYVVTNENRKDIYYSTEHGLSPSLEIPYADFYDDDKLASYVDQVHEEIP